MFPSMLGGHISILVSNFFLLSSIRLVWITFTDYWCTISYRGVFVWPAVNTFLNTTFLGFNTKALSVRADLEK